MTTWMMLCCAAAGGADFTTVSAPPKIPTAPVQGAPVEVSRELGRASGLAWQTGGAGQPETLWIAFEAARKVVRLVPGAVPSATTPPKVYDCVPGGSFVPGLLAYDAAPHGKLEPIGAPRRLWSISSDRLRISRLAVDPPTAENPFVSAVHGDRWIEPSHEAIRKIRGFAPAPGRDANGLPGAFILCRGGGLCSTIEARKLSDGELIFRFHPRCVPLNIAVAPDGRSLWILADNGPEAPAVVLQLSLEGSSTRERLRSAAKDPGRAYSVATRGRPSALAVSGGSMWVVSNEPSGSGHQQFMKSWVARFDVGSAP